MNAREYFAQEVSPSYLSVVADVLSHAITGELVGMQNFAMMVGITNDVEEQMELLDHADSERGHARTFRRIADDLGYPVTANTDAPYWKRLRTAFKKYIAAEDLEACVIIQEVMLESLAVAMYKEVGSKLPGRIGEIFTRIGEEEESHKDHSVAELQAAFLEDQEGFTNKVHQIHLEIMTVLAEMMAREDHSGHCEICNGNCIKESLPEVELDITRMRGAVLYEYLNMLDQIGIPGEKSLEWVAALPA